MRCVTIDECPQIYIMQQHTIATEALLLTQVRCVAYLDYLVPVMAGIHHQAASLPHSLSSLSLGKLAISLHNVLQWGWVESAMAQDRHRAGNVMKHTLETDHTDM